MSRLDAALAYIHASWSVFPCRQNDKAPATTNGLHAATTDADSIQAWWGDGQAFNIGVACEPSGLAVVDVDDPRGLDALVEAAGPLPPTLEVATPRGGRHLIYAGSIKSTTSKLARGVDTRGRGGYIVTPPSTTPDGAYTWANQLPIAPLPDWLAELADPPRSNHLQDAGTSTPAANDRWGQRVLDAELGRIAVALEGERNARLFEAACNVFEAVKGGHVDQDAAVEHLTLAAERAGLDGWEVGRTLDSAWDRVGERHPKELEQDTPRLVEAPPLGGADDDTEQGFEVLGVDELANIPPPQWLLDHRVPEGLTALIGQPKSGKTFTAIDWSASIAATRGGVLYWVGEGIAGFARRVAAWRIAHPHADLSRLKVVRKVPQLLDPESVRRFYTTVRRMQPKLVVIDTLSRATAGVRENDSENFTAAIKVFDEIRDAYGTSTLVVHHTNTAGQRPRGSNSLDGAVDALWRADRDDETPDTFQLFNVFMKDAEEAAPLLRRIVGQPNGSALALESELPRALHGRQA